MYYTVKADGDMLAAIHEGVEDAAVSTQGEDPVTRDEVLTVDEIAAYLKVGEATVRRWCREGTLPALKIGHQYRVRAADLQALWRPVSGKDAVGSARQESPSDGEEPGVTP